MGKRATRGGGLQSSSPRAAHGRAGGGWGMQRAVGSGPGRRATRTMRVPTAGDPGRLPLPTATERTGDKARGWSAANKQKGSCFSEKDWQKRSEKSQSSAYLMCWGTGRCEGNSCWSPLDEDNRENQTVFHIIIWGHNWKENKQWVRGGFWQRNWVITASFLMEFICQMRNVTGQKSYACLENILALRSSPSPAALPLWAAVKATSALAGTDVQSSCSSSWCERSHIHRIYVLKGWNH